MNDQARTSANEIGCVVLGITLMFCSALILFSLWKYQPFETVESQLIERQGAVVMDDTGA